METDIDLSGSKYLRRPWWFIVHRLVRINGPTDQYGVALSDSECASATVELGIFASQGIWLYRTRNIRKRMKEADMTWEEFPEAQEWQENNWRWPWVGKKSEDVKAPDTGFSANTERQYDYEGSTKL